MSLPESMIVTRAGGGNDRLAELVYENESLKIETAKLQGIIESTGALNVQNLQSERDNLQQSVAHLRSQLEERNGQLSALRSTNERFTHIDSTLQQLIAQLQSQRTELDTARQAMTDKDIQIADLTAKLQFAKEKQQRQDEEQSGLARASPDKLASAATDAERVRTLECERAALQEQLEAATRATEQLRHSSAEEATTLRKQLADAESQLQLLVKASMASAGSTATLHVTSSPLQQGDPGKTPPAAVDEVYIQRRVAEAVADLERRLREQTDLNASLMAYKALTQQEQATKPATTNMSADTKAVVSEQEQLRTKQQEAQQSMQRRMAQVLSGNNINKRAVETLLQEMLDYQEAMVEDMRTRLLIKDIQAEEMAKVYRLSQSRIESENASLMTQLRDALASEQRLRDTANNNNSMRAQATQQLLRSTEVGQVAAAHGAGGGVRQRTQRQPTTHMDPVSGILPTQYAAEGQVIREGARAPSCVPTLGVVVAAHNDNNGMNTAQTLHTANEATLACPACTFQQVGTNETCALCGWRLRQPRL